jgi:hypothetical protein
MFVDTLWDPLLRQPQQDILGLMTYGIHTDGSRNPFLGLTALGVFQPC